MTHEGAAGEHEVRAGGEEVFVYQEVFLFPAQEGVHALHFGVEELAHGNGCIVYGLEGLLERGLIVQCFSGVGNEDGGDAQGVVLDEYGGGRIPGGVAAGFEGGADTAVGEGGGVGLLLNQGFAVELLNHAAFSVGVQEGVVFLCGALGEGLEPVGDMGGAVLQRPYLHAFGYFVGGCGV